MNIKVVGIDLAKNVFQICVLGDDNSVIKNRKVSRDKLLHEVRQFPPNTLIAMEACLSSNYWGETIQNMGYQVKLLPAQHVKPMARRQKNDANDALAICEAAFRPNIHAVPIKTREQRDIKALRTVRSTLIVRRTATVNQVRALAAEYGVIFPKGLKTLQEQLPAALEDADNGLSTVIRSLLQGLYDDIKIISRDIDSLTDELTRLAKHHPRYQALLKIPDFGPIVTASVLSELGTGEQFTNGRQFSAWCGLVPRQHSSGGKSTLMGMTKNGNRELRTLLIHGARAVLRFAAKRQDAMGRWLNGLVARRGKVKAIVALANKLGRIAWRLISGDEEFQLSRAFKTA